MQKRDIGVLILAISCGALAFILAANFMKKPPVETKPSIPAASPKEQPTSIPIPNGMSALGLSSSEIENIPDTLNAGNYVDILGIAPNYADKMELQTLIRGAQVIKVDARKEEPGVQSITVALTPVGAEVVSKALTQGKIRLTLRPDNEEKGVLQTGAPGFIEVIRGVEKEKVTHAEK